MDEQALIDGLNHDLAGEYQAIVMYIQYSAKLTGPYRRELRALFQAEIADEQGHAAVWLGLEPALAGASDGGIRRPCAVALPGNSRGERPGKSPAKSPVAW